MYKNIAPLLFLVIIVNCQLYKPVLIWPAGYPTSDYTLFSKYKTTVEISFPGIQVILIDFPGLFGTIRGILRNLFVHPDKQIERVCKMIQINPIFANGYNAIGAGQSALFLRGLVQKCPIPRMKNLISLGGAQQGVFGIPGCSNLICKLLPYFISKIAYLSLVQKLWAQASYWNDPVIKDSYLSSSTFLADINNENFVNTTYINNLQTLQNFILVKYEDDANIQPIDTAWFGLKQISDSKSVNNSGVYARLGLNAMHRNGKLHFLSIPKDQLPWLLEKIIINFLV